MLSKISEHLKSKLHSFTDKDSIIFNNKVIEINNNFKPILKESKPLTFIDGGQAELISAANFNVSFIRVAAVTFHHKRIQQTIKEFYVVTTAKHESELIYESKIFGDVLIQEQDLTISSKDSSISGNERAPISKVAGIARRFAELSLASQFTDVVLDGTLETTYKNEEKYLPNVSALAKSSSLFTTSGNSPSILLNQRSSYETWSYFIDNKTHFVKLHKDAKHVFRFEGDTTLLPSLQQNSSDALFLGYPYGLIVADKLARVSNEEVKSIRMKFLLNKENSNIAKYLSTQNAHDILDNL